MNAKEDNFLFKLERFVPLNKFVAALEEKYPDHEENVDLSDEHIIAKKITAYVYRCCDDRVSKRYRFIYNILENIILSFLNTTQTDISHCIIARQPQTGNRILGKNYSQLTLLIHHTLQPNVRFYDEKRYDCLLDKRMFYMTNKVNLESFSVPHNKFVPSAEIQVKREREDALCLFFQQTFDLFQAYAYKHLKVNNKKDFLRKLNIRIIENFLKERSPVLGKEIYIDYNNMNRDDLRVLISYIKNKVEADDEEKD